MSQISTPLYEKLLAAASSEKVPVPRASASVVPWRHGPSGTLEVFWVRRSPAMRFMSGFFAFPGGGLARHDAEVPVHGEPREALPGQITAPLPDLTDAERGRLGPDLPPGLAACALRELFEETGILLRRAAADATPEVTSLHEARMRLLEKKTSFTELLTEHGVELSAEALHFAGRWMTPPLAPVRYDNRFFLLEWPPEREVQPHLLGGEHDLGEWIAPSAALERWRAGEVIAAPPILHILKVLAEVGPHAGLPRLQDPREADLGPMRRIEFRPGVVLLPLKTPTLLPATHTNAYLLGREEMVLIDPATPLPDEVERLKASVAAAVAQGRRISAIWLTHHHPDHVGAVNVMREELGVDVLAHPATAARLAPRGIRVDGELHGGERIVLAGSPPFPVRVYSTPGHAQGHLSFYEETCGSLVIGDLIAGIGTIVIDPPDGDMHDYLSSLEAMRDLAPKTIFPGHGPPVLQASEKLEEYRRHRLWREERILKAWQEGQKTARQMVASVYSDVPAEVHPVAVRQIEAHLARLVKLGRIPPE